MLRYHSDDRVWESKVLDLSLRNLQLLCSQLHTNKIIYINNERKLATCHHHSLHTSVKGALGPLGFLVLASKDLTGIYGSVFQNIARPEQVCKAVIKEPGELAWAQEITLLRSMFKRLWSLSWFMYIILELKRNPVVDLVHLQFITYTDWSLYSGELWRRRQSLHHS